MSIPYGVRVHKSFRVDCLDKSELFEATNDYGLVYGYLLPKQEYKLFIISRANMFLYIRDKFNTPSCLGVLYSVMSPGQKELFMKELPSFYEVFPNMTP